MERTGCRAQAAGLQARAWVRTEPAKAAAGGEGRARVERVLGADFMQPGLGKSSS